jgi:hypothetical protein
MGRNTGTKLGTFSQMLKFCKYTKCACLAAMLHWQAHFFFANPDFFYLAIQIIFEQLSSNFSLSTEQKALKSFGSSVGTSSIYGFSVLPFPAISPVV